MKLVNWYKSLTIAAKGSILNFDKDHRLASKYVTVALFVVSLHSVLPKYQEIPCLRQAQYLELKRD